MFKKFKTIIILASIFVIVTLLTLFIPILIFRNNEENNLKQTINLQELEIISYNPFKPKIRQYIKLDDPAYWVIDQEYQRTGLFSFELSDDSFRSFEQDDIIRVDGNNLDEAKANFKKQQDGGLTDEQKIMEERQAERKKPMECQRLLDMPNVGTVVEDFSFAKLNQPRLEFGKLYQESKIYGVTSVSYTLSQENYEEFRVDDEENTAIIKVRFLWEYSDSITKDSENMNKENKLLDLELITDSCQIIPVPTNPDGTFDFEAALEEVE